MDSSNNVPDLVGMFKAAIARARSEGVVATVSAPDGLSMFVYPSGQEFILGVGYGREHSHLVRAESVLRARAAFPSRYACWLPSAFYDGRWFLLRRFPWSAFDHGNAESMHDDLMNARRLLS